jgi:predicted enzyme related to lactoylglutathione lyase
MDLGIVTGNPAGMLEFYRDVLSLVLEGVVTLPGVGVLTKVKCGAGVIKLLMPEKSPRPGPQGMGYASFVGIRYFTVPVDDLTAVVERCRRAGVRVVVEPVSPRPGVWAAMVQDPDGNTVELMQFAEQADSKENK